MSVTDRADIAATCTAAADYLQKYGLYRHGFWPGTDFVHGAPVCLYGAICAATGLTSLDEGQGIDIVMDIMDCPATEAVQKEIFARTEQNVDIARYSDDLAEGVSDVVDLLRDVAAKHQPDAYRSGVAG